MARMIRLDTYSIEPITYMLKLARAIDVRSATLTLAVVFRNMPAEITFKMDGDLTDFSVRFLADGVSDALANELVALIYAGVTDRNRPAEELRLTRAEWEEQKKMAGDQPFIPMRS